jgi:hypothetical protein
MNRPTDFPPIPPKGRAIAFPAVAPQIVTHAPEDHHGLVVTGEGEIGLLIGGNGFRAYLPAEGWRALAYIAAQLAQQVAAQEHATRARANAELEKVVADHPLKTLPPEAFGNA